MTLIYEAENLKKYYGPSFVLDLPAFSLEKGSTLILVGANGSGKSTFLRLLAFLEGVSSGTLKFLGGPNPRRECTLLLQEPWLMRASVFANVVLGLKLRGIKGNLAEKYAFAMHSAGFQNPADFARRKPTALSGGEKQRIALASRLILNPSVLLLDEPTAHVDSESAHHIIKALIEAHEQGITIVCATHDETLATALQARTMKMLKPN